MTTRRRPQRGKRPTGTSFGRRAAVIVTAAGVGRRFSAARRGGSAKFFGGGRHKAFALLNGRPLVVWSLLACERAPAVAEVVVTVHPRDAAKVLALVRRWRCRKVRAVVPGGATRAESVAHGVAAVSPDVSIIAVHDAARPLVTPALIGRVVAAAARDGAALAAAPMVPTTKLVDSRGWVTSTLDRRRLWAAQTPQAFRRGLLERAYRRVRGRARQAATDEAMLLERCGIRSRVVADTPRNLKITTSEDLRMAEALLPSPRPSPLRGEGKG